MNYETMVAITQSTALVFFFVMFGLVLAYVFWPGNRRKFEHASRLPFTPDTHSENRKG